MQSLESKSEFPARWEGRSVPVHWRTARTLYNLVDVAWPECDPVRFLETLARTLRGEGPSDARHLWAACLWLDLEPILTGRERGRFWRLAAPARAAAAERFAQSRIGARRRVFERLAEAAAQSSSGA